MPTIVDVATFIAGEMTKNAASTVTKTIAGYLADGAILHPLKFYDACQLWKAWVGNRRPWDYKRFLRSTYGEWSADSVSGYSYNFDIWSNVHYGYVGRAAGFSAWTLKAGAGAAQQAAGTSPDGYWSRRFDTIGDADFLAAFDDPKDQVAIEVGVGLWETYALAMTLTNLLDSVRAAAARLDTKK
jgi:Bacterial toxin 44